MARTRRAERSGRDDMLLSYRPDRGEYTEKSHAEVKSAIERAKVMAGIIRKVGEDAQQDQQRLTNLFDYMTKLFEGSHDLGIPQSKRYVSFDAKSSKPADVIFRVMGMLTVPPKFQYIAPKGSRKAERANDDIEAYLNAYPKWLFRKYGKRWDFHSRFWQLLMGYSYLRQSYLPFYWDKNVRQRRDGESDEDFNSRIEGFKGYKGPPFVVESLDPRTVFPLKTKLGNSGYVLHYRVSRYDFNDAFSRVGKAVQVDQAGKVVGVEELTKRAGQVLPVQTEQTVLTGDIEYWELIDDVMSYYVVGDQVVHRYKHNGGVKIFPAYGLETGFEEHHLAAMGILWAVRNELPQYDFMRTLWMQKAYLDVFPQLLAQLSGDEDPILGDDDKPVQWNLEPGTIKQIRGTLVNAMRDSQSGVDYRAAVEMIAADIDLATIPGLARGIVGAQQPGININQSSQIMRTLWRGLIESGELQYSMLGEHLLWCHKNLVRESSSMYTEVDEEETGRRSGKFLEMDPDDIDEYCMVSAQLKPDLPIDRQGNARSWWELHSQGGATFEDYVREGLDKSNPVAYRQRVERDAGRRMMFAEAVKDSQALGRVKLTNDVLASRGLDRLNAIGNMDIQALKAARSKQEMPPPGAQAAAPGVPEAPVGAPGGAGGMAAPVPPEAGQGGAGIPPTAGAMPPPRRMQP